MGPVLQELLWGKQAGRAPCQPPAHVTVQFPHSGPETSEGPRLTGPHSPEDKAPAEGLL